jgi:uncharacterized protein YfdQ (DUF2303 family)
MFDANAIEKLAEAQSIGAAAAATAAGLQMGVVALPEDFNLHDLEKHQECRRRARGNMETSVIADFANYVTHHAEQGATVFVDADAMTAVAVLNLGSPEAPGHCDNHARLKLKRTSAYSALRAIATGAGHKQSTIAEFFEDWPSELRFFNDEGQITPNRAIAAIRKVTIEALRKLESTEQSLSASKSSFESVAATSSEPIPTYIYFDCVPYADLQPRTFVMRLTIGTGGDKPTIGLRIIKQEQHDEEMARELAALVVDALPTTPALIGTYAVKA